MNGLQVYYQGRPGITHEDQARIPVLLSKCAVVGDACWEWLDAKQQFGYGMFWLKSQGSRNGKSSIPAHRASYYLFVGEIPPGQQVRHMCHNPGCVNPRHLRTGTALENAQDKRDRWAA
jgi:hypothetical protein